MWEEPELQQQPLAALPRRQQAPGWELPRALQPPRAGCSGLGSVMPRDALGLLELLCDQPEQQPDAASQQSLPTARGGGAAEPCASQLSISEAF